MRSVLILFAFLAYFSAYSQVTLIADGPGDTYELITSKLAPGYKPIEAPGKKKGDCDNHSSFNDTHITEVFNQELQKNVFKFVIHVEEDNDRCKKFDRQRNEIKSYKSSPDNLKGVLGETVEYKWKFKLDKGFQPSKKFTHLHQLKAVGGFDKDMPLITLTARKGSVDRLELRYSSGLDQNTLTYVALSAFKGKWVDVIETVTYEEKGKAKFSILIKDLKTGAKILEYNDDTLRMWKTQADFIRPKWGIYRSLKHSSDLRDEEILFADFSITEI
ncbi:fibronectin type III [Aquimarina sp. BL5]|uniref:heparin lyase I family protein n=1 Tax=Aquimarina sp. BL5 TaxID=1714860 RepID=UPI000E4FD1F5|nr:heparin lyase I family protein [Aquimarina sp. BL5]AXT50475.1 fibronectin type III [Aquimarina sp. BL5]RKN03053.1 fibronectin type III [Aquimarina sp. BL5]